MKAGARSKANLFLIELLIMLMFFAVSAAICLRVFVGAKNISKSAGDLSAALMHAQSAAECFKASGGDMLDVSVMLADASAMIDVTADGDSITLYYDALWQRCEGSQAAFALTVEKSGDAQAGIYVYESSGSQTLAELHAGAVRYE